MKVIHSTEMTCTSHGSNKFYDVQLHQESTNSFSTYVAHGAIGKAKRFSPKVANVSFDEAKKAYNKVVKEKTSARKGYVIINTHDDTSPSTEKVAKPIKKQEPVQSSIPVQLLNPITKAQAQPLISDATWLMQEKMDGERRPIEITKNQFKALNRRAEYIGELPDEILKGIDTSEPMILDTEDMGDHLVAFDVLEYAGQDVTNYPLSMRLQILRQAVANQRTIKLVRIATTEEEKTALLADVTAENGEGVVFKEASSKYTNSRPNSGGSALKYKLYDEASVVVIAKNTQRSVQIGVYLSDDVNDITPVGNVTIPANAEIPEPKDIIEVRYLYAYEGGSLYQPTFLKPRTDLRVSDLLKTSLKYKAA